MPIFSATSDLFLPGDRTQAAEAWLQRDPQWVAPLLWRSELRNVLATQVRAERLPLDAAVRIQQEAESLMHGEDFSVDSAEVLRLAAESGCSAYDCELVALADYLKVPLVTADKRLEHSFPAIVSPLG